MKYCVYCLYKDDKIIYIGSSTKLLQRLRTHNRDKEFDKVVYCELPNKQLMLDVEMFAIDKVKPPLNRIISTPSMKEKPEGLRWIGANLSFLHYRKVDIYHHLSYNVWWEYYHMVCDRFGIAKIDPYNENFTYIKLGDKVAAVFDGSGLTLEELAASEDMISLNEYENIRYKEEGLISAAEYEWSLTQFD